MSPSKKIPLQWRNSTAQNITSIPIPTDGLYFVYLNIAYRMPFAKYDTKFQYLAANVTSFGEAYPQGRRKLFFMDTMACVYPNFRNIYIGRLIQLKANDKLEVTATPNELIDSFKNGVFFGGYLVHKLK